MDGGGEREPCFFKGVEEGVRKGGSGVFRCISAVEYSQVSLEAGPQPSIKGESSSAFFVPCIRSCRTNSLRWQNALMQELGVPIKGHVKKWLKQEHVSD